MVVRDITVQNQVGLHARPATFFIQKANEFKSSIWVEKDERRANAKSLLGVLSLGVTVGTDIRIQSLLFPVLPNKLNRYGKLCVGTLRCTFFFFGGKIWIYGS